MKILYFFDAIARVGGTERILTEKMNSLVENYGQDVYLITVSQGNHPFTFPLSSKIRHIDLAVRFHTIYKYSLFKRLYMKRKLNKELVIKLTEVISEISPSIIIATHYFAADVICNIKCTAKKIVESHAVKKNIMLNDGKEKGVISKIYAGWKWKRYFKTIEENSDMIVTLTEGDAKDWNTKNVIVIPNSISPYKGQACKQDSKVVLFAGRFLYEKGIDRMLEAWRIVVNNRKDWTLKLVGDGDMKKDLVKQCKILGIEDYVIFAGFTKNMIEEYSNSSLFLLTSRYEGFGLVLVEAMQCGVPCVAFDCPYGPSDIIDNGKNGVIVEDGNIEALANAILKLMDDEELRKNMGKAAKEKAKDYLPETIMPQWMKLFNDLIA